MPRFIRPGRRRFLQMSAATAMAGVLPENVRRALAVPPNRQGGGIEDIEHVIILMQENRAFDHYFGCMKGVRGYSDPQPEFLPDGRSPLAQRDRHGRTVLPFRFNTATTSAGCLPSLDHSWKGSQALWNNWDAWIDVKTPMTMGYFDRQDIPYYYALADAFTICDNYHASIFGPTNPNRLFLFTGTSGLACGQDGVQVVTNVDDGNGSADMALDRKDFRAFTWKTYGDRLLEHGVSWKIYQEYDNFTDNPLASFAQFRNLSPHSARYRAARSIVPGSDASNAHTSEGQFLVAALEHDIMHRTLPQVSWIVPPQHLSEHPDAPPGYGEYLISRLMDVLSRHPDVWSKTVFILNYDENDGFFDHIPAPVPALDTTQGGSNVPVTGEIYQGEPVGLGPRVPMIVISPWTKGGWVNSQMFDHTSVIRFLERRFGVMEPNITPWRRSVCGDLTSLFDFGVTDRQWQAALPDTAHYPTQTDAACHLAPPQVPHRQHFPMQETGQRPARPLPYRHTARIHAHDGALDLVLDNPGDVGVVFRLYGVDVHGPRHFTVAAHSNFRFTLPPTMASHTLRLHGPNGFVRTWTLPHLSCVLEVAESYDTDTGNLRLTLRNTRRNRLRVNMDMVDYADYPPVRLDIPPLGSVTHDWNLAASDHWYDLRLTCGGHPHFVARLAGHMETGRPSRSDPRLGGAPSITHLPKRA
ncbi:phosphocholine-specific phospholipase C [Komagataeibacter europaeus]|uniref:phosphocholine-specific phospholipase C n=1 Tax=Komagataeibacter europaeus TaxID=33995 RepID=UPI000237F0D7|nr:phospholipase C, phosphocholine-specific [Komagataeibacter europaeus]